jgi:hypothetical protein
MAGGFNAALAGFFGGVFSDSRIDTSYGAIEWRSYDNDSDPELWPNWFDWTRRLRRPRYPGDLGFEADIYSIAWDGYELPLQSRYRIVPDPSSTQQDWHFRVRGRKHSVFMQLFDFHSEALVAEHHFTDGVEWDIHVTPTGEPHELAFPVAKVTVVN